MGFMHLYARPFDRGKISLPLLSPAAAPGARASDMPSCYIHPRGQVPVVPTLPAPPAIDQTTEEPGR